MAMFFLYLLIETANNNDVIVFFSFDFQSHLHLWRVGVCKLPVSEIFPLFYESNDLVSSNFAFW